MDLKDAPSGAETAVLSALAHAHQPYAAEVAQVAFERLAAVQGHNHARYFELNLDALPQALQNAFRNAMKLADFEPKTEFVRELRAERLALTAKAMVEGRRESLCEVLAASELVVSPAALAKLAECTDTAELDRLTRLAAREWVLSPAALAKIAECTDRAEFDHLTRLAVLAPSAKQFEQDM